MNVPTEQIVCFLRSIGITVETGSIEEKTALPGITIRAGGLVIDETRMLYPGDLLHEAGHLAVIPAAERSAADGNLPGDPAHEMGAIAWSYAAALHIGIDPRVVFHEAGYRDGSTSLLGNFSAGHYLAVPLLQWMGLTLDEKKAREQSAAPYPHMQRWLRE